MSTSRRAGSTIAAIMIAAMAVAGCTSPRDTIVESPSDTTAPEEPAATAPGITQPDITDPEVTEPEVTEPEVTEPGTTEPIDATQPTSEPSTSEPPATEPPATEPGDPSSDVAPESDDDRNETSVVAAIIGLLGFAVLLVLAARWMVGLDDRREGEPPLPRDPDDGLPSDQMSL